MTIERFVDAHVHFWDLDHIDYPWLTPPFATGGAAGSVAAIAKNYGLSDYFTDAKGFNVPKIVHVDAGANPADALRETAWLQKMADDNGYPTAIIAFAALDHPAVETLLAQHVEYPATRGIRHILNWHPDPQLSSTPHNLLESDAFKSGFALLAKYGLSFDLQINPCQMMQAVDLIGRHPDIPVALNHIGMPVDQSDDGVAVWHAGMKALAALPNVIVKISGLGFVDRNWTADTMRDTVLEIIDLFGSERCAFASDFPTDKLFNSFGHALNAYDEMTRAMTAIERDNLFAGTAERFYRI